MSNEIKPNTLEHFILYCAYAKSIVKRININIQTLSQQGIIDEAEMALIER